MPLDMVGKTERGVKHVIGIAAGKGGVGKSTVTVNLARALKNEGHQVGILDADLYGPSIRRMLPEDRLPKQKGPSIIPALCDGIRVVSLAYFRRENQAAAVRAPIATGMIKQFLHQVEWGELDYLLIDFPPGTGDIQITLSQDAQLTGAVVVTTPQEVSVMDVRKAADLFRHVKVPLLGLIENMSYFEVEECRHYPFGKGGGARLADEMGVPMLGEIPIHSSISEAGDKGRPIGHEMAASAFQRMTRKVLDEVEAVKNNDRLSEFELVWREM